MGILSKERHEGPLSRNWFREFSSERHGVDSRMLRVAFDHALGELKEWLQEGPSAEAHLRNAAFLLGGLGSLPRTRPEVFPGKVTDRVLSTPIVGVMTQEQQAMAKAIAAYGVVADSLSLLADATRSDPRGTEGQNSQAQEAVARISDDARTHAATMRETLMCCVGRLFESASLRIVERDGRRAVEACIPSQTVQGIREGNFRHPPF